MGVYLLPLHLHMMQLLVHALNTLTMEVPCLEICMYMFLHYLHLLNNMEIDALPADKLLVFSLFHNISLVWLLYYLDHYLPEEGRLLSIHAQVCLFHLYYMYYYCKCIELILVLLLLSNETLNLICLSLLHQFEMYQ